MAKLLCSAILLFLSLQAWAQKAAGDVPSEQASPVVVVAFLVIFIGGCITFMAYVWWRGRGKP
jgi:hypothetical protein